MTTLNIKNNSSFITVSAGCGYCGSTNCGSLFGDPICNELPVTTAEVKCLYCGSSNCGSLYGDPVCNELPTK